jgi:hypothetical protein
VTYRDKTGREIVPGDLLKTFHFTGARKRRHWLYHTVVQEEGRLWLVPTCWLEPTKVSGGGRCCIGWLDTALDGFLRDCEIISGHGPGAILSYEDRPRSPVPPTDTEE